jgi:L-alanine-DL-glutamate epimerase-like enolase superfamily enzyme
MSNLSTTITAIEWAPLVGTRPRSAGCNARLGEHGVNVRVPVARLSTADGSSGFGYAQLTLEQASGILGQRLETLFSPGSGATDAALAIDFPLWDLMARRGGRPVYALAAELAGRSSVEPYSVPCYDTSLYFDDLQLESESDAAELMADEARAGHTRGHRSFKIKVGRGARHLPLEEGTQRDIAIIQAIRDAVGPTATLMLDANNGYNLNLAKDVLSACAECDIFWLEEAFHEDPILYSDLKEWLRDRESSLLIADGEGLAAQPLLEWARDGLVDVIQYDIFSYGFSRWLTLGQQLDEWGIRTAPHHYGRHLGNYVSAHLAAAIQGFTFVEWDEASTPGLAAPGYAIAEGHVEVPATAGFGLELDDDRFQHAVQKQGFKVQI